MLNPRKAEGTGDRPDFLTAALLVGFGALGLWAGRDLTLGTASAMGPGYLPRIVCCLLIIVGVTVGGLGAFRQREEISKPKLWPVAIILASVVGFAFIAEFFGFVAASVWLLLVGSIADRDSKLREVLILTAGLTAFGALVFIVGLGVQMPIWPF
ncbi:tripartite tricarboxylate transporter TctB family protein [Sinorhizobium sp. NFACC03]|uniref:tripartite tricarboxylate transporter TctB family protein n=1 Tax=Sinorhizobium sp. NFACC03 TaxID=1566295 RepID=UPI000885FA23|nr:tripartite tricarboxylate transporter TctB family protein [Sinorhizobium sp. NFACC03]SDA93792.1 Tripartite tricarboxylate transporter TctB family protein [Sinorhizobium sp. NFACC03]